ncbi:MAG: hypothetical protein ACKV1O_30315 [Saprospiraceae bacterium]
MALSKLIASCQIKMGPDLEHAVSTVFFGLTFTKAGWAALCRGMVTGMNFCPLLVSFISKEFAVSLSVFAIAKTSIFLSFSPAQGTFPLPINTSQSGAPVPLRKISKGKVSEIGPVGFWEGLRPGSFRLYVMVVVWALIKKGITSNHKKAIVFIMNYFRD